MIIRSEAGGDEAAIHSLTRLAFAPVEMSDGSEPLIVDQLRRRGELFLSLVVTDGDRIVGHVAFSEVTVSDAEGQWFGLGPISVHPDRQRERIGARLVAEGLKRLRAFGAAGCVLVGDPAFYGRFGFTSSDDLSFGEVPTQYVQALSFRDIRAKGSLRFSSAFGS